MAELDADNARQQTLASRDDSPAHLPASLANLEHRRQKIRDALVQAQAADEARRQLGRNPEKNPAQVPTTDPESRVMPHKDGGYASNYTPTATTDGHRGFVVDCDVTSDVNEGSLATLSVDQIEEAFGEKPWTFLTDGGNNSGAVMHQMEQRRVEFLAPVESCLLQPGSPALRDDPTQPVANSQKSQLPRNWQGQLAKNCFVYVAERDTYYCPQRHTMPHEKSKRDRRRHEPVMRRIYRCRYLFTEKTGLRILRRLISFRKSWIETTNNSLNVLVADGCRRSWKSFGGRSSCCRKRWTNRGGLASDRRLRFGRGK